MYEMDNSRPFTINELARCVVDNQDSFDLYGVPTSGYGFLVRMMDKGGVKAKRAPQLSIIGKLSAYELCFTSSGDSWYVNHNPLSKTRVIGATEQYRQLLSTALENMCRAQTVRTIKECRKAIQSKLPDILLSYNLVWPVDETSFSSWEDGSDWLDSSTSQRRRYESVWSLDKSKTNEYLVKPTCAYIEQWFDAYMRTHNITRGR